MKQTQKMAPCSSANSLQVLGFAPMSVMAYARCEDFRRFFLENLDSLYLLCFLLTSDCERAQECLTAAFDQCAKSRYVAKNEVHTWVKRVLVQNAIVTTQAHVEGKQSFHAEMRTPEICPAFANSFEVAAMLSLADFERFVFVLTVLEQYSDSDCALLLGCSLDGIRKARACAFEQLTCSFHNGAKQALETNTLGVTNS